MAETAITRTQADEFNERLGRVYSFLLTLRPKADDGAHTATNQVAPPPANVTPGKDPDAKGS